VIESGSQRLHRHGPDRLVRDPSAQLGLSRDRTYPSAWYRRGLVRHYWVAAKLLLTGFATAILLLKLAPISDLANAASQGSFSPTSMVDLKQSMLAHSVGGLTVLLLISILAIHKPAGLTPLAGGGGSSALPKSVRLSLTVTAAFALIAAC
jgi:hypothetical protein